MNNNKAKDSNRPSQLLSLPENNAVFDALGPRKITKSTTVAQVYFADPNPRIWTKQFTGVLCFVKDNQKRSYFLRLVDLSKRDVVWEQELYYEIEYLKATKNFHTFASLQCMVGFNFANLEEANHFFDAIMVKIEEYQTKKGGIKRQAPPTPGTNPPPPLGVPSQPVNGVSGPTLAGPVGGLTANISFDKPKDKKNKKKALTKQDISAPKNFVHLAHVGWDPSTEKFEWNNIKDDRWKLLFTEVAENIGQTNLDNDQIELICDMVEKKGGIEAATTDIQNRKNSIRRGAPPPPAPTSNKKRDETPAPPSNTKNKNKPNEAPPIPSNHPSTIKKGSTAVNKNIPPPPPDMPREFQTGTGGGSSVPPPPKRTGPGGPPEPPPASAKKNNILDSINTFDPSKLKPVESVPADKHVSTVEDEGGIVGALAKALLSRNIAIRPPSDSDEDADYGSDEWMDD